METMTKLQIWAKWDSIVESASIKAGWDNDTEPWDYYWVDINPIPWEDDLLDAVMLFADGCVEFHLKHNMDAENWSKFSVEINESILSQFINF